MAEVTFTSADVDLIMALQITGMFVPEEMNQVKALRDKLDALIEYYSADYGADDDEEYLDYGDDDEPYDDYD